MPTQPKTIVPGEPVRPASVLSSRRPPQPSGSSDRSGAISSSDFGFCALRSATGAQHSKLFAHHAFPSWLLLTFLLLPWIQLTPAQQPAQPSEYQIKSVYLFNFTKFIEWPSNSFASASSPFVIGIVGENPFGADLDRTLRNQDLNGHKFVIREVSRPSEARACHILFIARSERRRVTEILAAIGDAPVLTVSETDRFLQNGGIIRLYMEGRKVRFEINDAQAKRVGLKISSKLLGLSKKPDQ